MAFFNKFKNIVSRENKSQEDKDLEKKKLDNSLNKTKNTLFEKISKTIVGKSKIDDNDLDDFEEILISSDIGEDPDKRDYIVSNDKIEKLGWKPNKTIEIGIEELIKLYKIINLSSFSNY